MNSKLKAHTLMYGLSLIVLGVGGYLITGAESITALIPGFFGLLVLAVSMATTRMQNYKTAGIIMMALGLIGFLATAKGIASLPGLIGGDEIARPAAVISQSIMSFLSLIYMFLLGSKVFGGGRRAAAKSS